MNRLELLRELDARHTSLTWEWDDEAVAIREYLRGEIEAEERRERRTRKLYLDQRIDALSDRVECLEKLFRAFTATYGG